MARYPLVGGPCDGQSSVNYTIRPFVGFTWDCGTHTYIFQADGAFHDGGLAAVFGGTPSVPVDTKQVGRAWHKLTHTLGVEAPAAIRKSQAGRSRLRRVVR